MKSEHKMLSSRREDNKEGRIISATTVEKTGMVCISAHTQEDILEMDKEEVLEDKLLHPETRPKHLLSTPATSCSASNIKGTTSNCRNSTFTGSE